MPDETVMWCGTPIKELSRGELEEAFLQIAHEYARFFTPTAMRERVLGRIQAMKERMSYDATLVDED